MRLQVAVHRHTLPPVNIIFATGTGPASQTSNGASTIFNLLEDINDLIPLESSDGEWGLEDYTVEVAATADQEATYQCLHYLPLKSVLREDDEVTIRPLGSDDLRAWRRGGRMQITADGRHLIDGVVFSKPWARKDTSRPGIAIPPRKRRRLLLEDEESQKENLEPEDLPLPTIDSVEDSDGDLDEDYIDEAGERAVSLREIFEDADVSGEELSDVDGDELQLLLEDAAELETSEDVDNLLESQLKARTRLGKRKRQNEDDADSPDDAPFEGFESPVKSRVLQDVSHQFNSVEDDDSSDVDSLLDEITQKERLKKQQNLLNDEDSDDSSDEDFAAGESLSESEDDVVEEEIQLEAVVVDDGARDSDVDSIMEDIAQKNLARKLANQIDDDDDDEESSDEDFSASSSDSDETSESAEEVQAGHKNKQAVVPPSTADDHSAESSDSSDSSSSSEDSESSDSNADNDSSSETSSTSDSEDSDGSNEVQQKKLSQTKLAETKVNDPKPSNSGQKVSQTPPGQGLQRTRNNNVRIKRRKRLDDLKSQGLLPTNANFKDLDRYDLTASVSEEPSSMQVQDELEAARQRALAQLLDPPSKSQEKQEELEVAQSIEPQDDEQPQGDSESPVIPETQEKEGDGPRGLPIRLPDIPKPASMRLNALSEPERACEWLRTFFEPSAESAVYQDAVHVAYSRFFDQPNTLAGSVFLPCISKVFKDAHVVDLIDPYSAIEGIRLVETVDEPKETEAAAPAVGSEADASSVIPTSEKRPAPITDLPETSDRTVSEPSPKRAKLDLTASRRMIFGALGSRNPKTAAQAQAVREKLAGPIRQTKTQASAASEEPARPVESTDDDFRWEDKLIVTAVECEREGVTYPPPPFPFVQHWHKNGKSKRHSVQMERVSSQESKASQKTKPEKQNSVPESTVKPADNAESVMESRTVSFDRDDRDGMPIPTDFNALPDLDRKDVLPGAVIAFKQMDLNISTFMPYLSKHKVARIDSFRKDTVHITLATRSRLTAAQDSNMSDEGEDKYSQFVIQSGEEDDGIREMLYEDMQEAKLIEASSVQVPASHHGEAAGHKQDTQEISSQAVAESVVRPQADDVSSLPVPVEPLSIASPRRHEISAMINEAGFNSAIGEYQLNVNISSQPEVSSQPQNSEGGEEIGSDAYNHNESALSQARANTSSPFFPPQQEDDIVIQDDVVEESMDVAEPEDPVPTSSPPISPQLTVDYPSLSRIELGSDAQQLGSASRNSSSHQDAQRQSPDVMEADTTLIASEHRDKLHPIDEPSVVASESELPRSSQPAQTDQDDIDIDEEEEREATSVPQSQSFLGAGLDGQAESSFHLSDEDFPSDDSDSLPSLDGTFTSSQKRKIMTRATSAPKSANKKISPPATKRRPVRSSAPSRFYVPPDLSSDSDEELLPSVKSESSQLPRFSQIPAGSQVVDLTLSSDPVSPGGSDGGFQAQQSRSRNGRMNGNSQGRGTRRAVTEGASQQSLGIGQKKFLTTKKTKSFV